MNKDNSRNTLVYMIHGLGGSSNDWSEKDGYTKGGNLTEQLDLRGIPWTAPDLYGHGDWDPDEPDFNPDGLDDPLWEKTIRLSVERMTGQIAHLCREGDYRQLELVTYSAGAVFGIKLAGGDLPVPVRSLYLASAPPQREYDDGYSLHNNLEIFRNRRVFFYTGNTDTEIPPGESRWLFEQLPSEDKRFREYSSGHDLPAAWTADCIKDMGF